jgi:hypothetical protein
MTVVALESAPWDLVAMVMGLAGAAAIFLVAGLLGERLTGD